ncbi:MAG TPA: type III-B CRISPR module RAMP protein Cmr6 [Pyrinomonadaceae bacterium]|nr:type III-B CRISPR module RAMP protein Cmr6 [Pyrinomonadaceae bacterium]HLE62653.1 type III-B CRISPR module RAMP protein Cmr6 [Pyrinomonadaceae bacterium]
MPTRRQSLRNIKLNDCNAPHSGLWLDKFIVEQARSNKEARKTLVSEVSGIRVPQLYGQVYERWLRLLSSFKSSGYAVVRSEATVSGRMLLGTGNESVLETAMTLHRTYGVPYIPGSALKGLAANFAQQYCGADWKKTSRNYKIVFGNTAESGCIIFFDALLIALVGETPLRRDVLTPHHGDYYSGKVDNATGNLLPPADWDDPKPVHFLSATGSYLIALAASTGGEDWLKAVMEILKNALNELGIGAKTSSGYGRMSLNVNSNEVTNDGSI